MSRWKALPAELDPRVRQLLVRLRRLKDHSGLSMRQLAAKTAYSPKSWERYLSGRSLPPRDAVEAMARIGGDDPTRLLALHEVAAEAWRAGRAGTSAPEPAVTEPAVTEPAVAESSVPAVPAPEPEVLSAGTEDARSPGRALRVALVSGSVALVLAVSSTVLVVVRIMDDRDGGAPAASHATPTASASPTVAKRVYRCRLERTGGRWYAGNSRALDATVAYGNSGPQVAEVQCLLRRRGISPGAIDGMFGPLTMGAVERFQKRARLQVDGIVGPRTWKALRG
ncbi:peptidoglycan-binding protein [Streptomyces sp. NPDC087903]|uniref:peptidoglycan-binding protein n=1 Tax=Streptomyces sp. NPDC087903 TaxID=3365819 RepID=UPI00382C167F